jgi:glycosyltransferase involved in cell wall biosynthesis
VRILYLTFDDLTVPFAWSVHVREVVNGLVARGHQVRLVCPGAAAPGVNAPCDPLRPGKLRHVAGSLVDFLRSGREFQPDIVYVRGIHGTLTPALAAGRLERPLVVEINGLLEEEVKGWRRALARKTHRFTLRRASRVITVSPLLRDAIAERYSYPPDRIDVIPNGADTDLFRPSDRAEARRQLGLPIDRPIIVCVAGFFSHHALDLLISAAARARALLVLVGKSGPTGGDLIHVGRVPHEKVPVYVAAADVCAYVLRAPHAQSGYSPLKVYEYMAAGRPVVAATDLEEIRTFINGENIGVATPLEVDAFAAAMVGLFEDGERRRRMGEAGRALAERRFTWQLSAAAVEHSLERTLAR